MKTTVSLLSFVALFATIYACAPLTQKVDTGPPLNNSKTFTNDTANDTEHQKKIVQLSLEITKTEKSVEEAENDVNSKTDELQKLDLENTIAVVALQSIAAKLNEEGLVAVSRFNQTINEYKKKNNELKKAKTELNKQRKKLGELEVEKKVLGYGQLSNEAFDQKIEEVTTKLTESSANLKTATGDLLKRQAEIAKIENDNKEAFAYIYGLRNIQLLTDQGREYWKLKDELKTIDEDSAEYKAKEEKIAKLLERMVAPNFIGKSKEEFNRKLTKPELEPTDEQIQAVEIVEDYEAKKSKLPAASIAVEKIQLTIHTLEFEKKTLQNQKTIKK